MPLNSKANECDGTPRRVARSRDLSSPVRVAEKPACYIDLRRGESG